MFDMVTARQSNGQTQSIFAQDKNVNLHTFKYWLYKFRQEYEQPKDFIQLDQVPSQNICLRYPNGVELLVPAQTPATTLRELIKFTSWCFR